MLELDNTQGAMPAAADPPPNKFAPFGKYAGIAKQQGFFPETDPDQNGQVVFRNNFSKAFNDVVIPDTPGEKGHVAFIGNGNQKFDVVIRDNDGKVRMTMFKGISPDDVQTYINKAGGLVDTRNNNVLKNVPAQSVAANQLPIGNASLF